MKSSKLSKILVYSLSNTLEWGHFNKCANMTWVQLVQLYFATGTDKWRTRGASCKCFVQVLTQYTAFLSNELCVDNNNRKGTRKKQRRSAFTNKKSVQPEVTSFRLLIFYSDNLNQSESILVSRQKCEFGTNMECSNKCIHLQWSPFSDIHMVKLGWRFGILVFSAFPVQKYSYAHAQAERPQ